MIADECLLILDQNNSLLQKLSSNEERYVQDLKFQFDKNTAEFAEVERKYQDDMMRLDAVVCRLSDELSTARKCSTETQINVDSLDHLMCELEKYKTLVLQLQSGDDDLSRAQTDLRIAHGETFSLLHVTTHCDFILDSALLKIELVSWILRKKKLTEGIKVCWKNLSPIKLEWIHLSINAKKQFLA